MKWHRELRIILSVACLFLFLFLLLAAIYYLYSHTRRVQTTKRSGEDSLESADSECAGAEAEELAAFAGGQHLRIQDILDAPGEVVGKSSYGTLYRAGIRRSFAGYGGGGYAVDAMLLRLVRPVCVLRSGEILPAIREIGLVRHPNLVPLRALYVGPRGEKLFIHPFYAAGNLAQFLKGRNTESKLSNRWEVIHKLSLGIARGLNHLHNGSQKSLIHGNLKSKNVLLDANLQPRLSDFGIHLLLRPVAAQGMFEASALEGYKAPELIKMKEASRETDIYSFGIILLEMITHKEATSCRLLVLNQNLLDVFSKGVISGRKDQSLNIEAPLRRFRQLAMACCSSSPALRPDIKQVVKKLEEIG